LPHPGRGFPVDERSTLDLPDGGAVVPLRIESDRRVVDVMIHGEGPFSFIVDTGASGDGRITSALIERLGFDKVGRIRVGDLSGRNEDERDLVAVDRVDLGPVGLRDGTFLVTGPNALLEGIDGSIGQGELRERLGGAEPVTMRVRRGD